MSIARVFMSFEYDEFRQGTYKHIKVSVTDADKVVYFNTGDPVVDYIDFMRWISKNDVLSVGYSSSFDHFLMDEDKYRLEYVDYERECFISQEELDNMGWDQLSMANVIVTDDIKTFAELKAYYKDKKQERITSELG